MSTTGKAPRKPSDFVAGLKGQGVDWLPNVVLGASMGESQPISMMVTRLTASATTLGVDFATEFGATFEDSDYAVFLDSDLNTGALGYNSKSASALEINGVENNEVVSVMLVGKLTSQP